MTKQQYIEEARYIIFHDLGNYIRTDIDDETNADGYPDDIEMQDMRSKANIIRFDMLFVVWLNGVVWAWNITHKPNFITKDDIVPNFYKIFDDSCVYYDDGQFRSSGEFPRL